MDKEEFKRWVKKSIKESIVSIKTLAIFLDRDNLRFHMDVNEETTIEEVLNYICGELTVN